MTIGGRHFSDVLNGHLWPEGLQRFSNWGPFEGPSSCDSRTFGRKGTGCHWNGCTKDMTQQEQTLAQLKVGPKEHEKIWKKKKECILSILFKFINFILFYLKFITIIYCMSILV